MGSNINQLKSVGKHTVATATQRYALAVDGESEGWSGEKATVADDVWLACRDPWSEASLWPLHAQYANDSESGGGRQHKKAGAEGGGVERHTGRAHRTAVH